MVLLLEALYIVFVKLIIIGIFSVFFFRGTLERFY